MQLRRNVVKIHYHKITSQGGEWVSLLVVTVSNVKCGYFRVVAFFCRPNFNQNYEETNENCSNFTFSVVSNCNNSNTV